MTVREFGNTAKGRKGAIGVLTNGRVYRDELEEYAVIMAITKITVMTRIMEMTKIKLRMEVNKKPLHFRQI